MGVHRINDVHRHCILDLTTPKTTVIGLKKYKQGNDNRFRPLSRAGEEKLNSVCRQVWLFEINTAEKNKKQNTKRHRK